MVFIPPSSSGSAKRIRNVSISGTAPTANQVLTASNGTTAAWATASAGSTDGWTADTNTWTYSTVDGATGTVTINADLTGTIQAGDRIKFTQTTVKYFIVTKTPTFATGNTTLIFWGGTDYTLANAAITSPSYSHAKSPFGMNIDPTKWTISFTDANERLQVSPSAGTWYNPGTSTIAVHIGAWRVWYSATLAVIGGTNPEGNVQLSTANNASSDTDLQCGFWTSNNSDFRGGIAFKEKNIVITSKTSYYLIMQCGNSGNSNLGFEGNRSTTVIRAVCAFL